MTDCTAEGRFLLDESDSRRIFRDRIVPDQLTGTPQEQPVVVFVTGQPGDGKTAITALVKTALRDHDHDHVSDRDHDHDRDHDRDSDHDREGDGDRGWPVVLCAAGYEPYHPRFHEPITDEPPMAAQYVEADGRRWLEQARELVIEERYDAIVETELADPDWFATTALAFKDAGYHVEVAIVAVHEAVSRLGVLENHLRALENYGFARATPQSIHDAAYDGVLRAASLIDEGEWADRVAVLRPNGDVVYRNQRDPEGQWQQPAATADAITEERERPWTVAESRHFLETASHVGRIGLRAPTDWIRDESVEGAEMVTALARPRLHPDAVTLHIATAGTLADESRTTS